MTSGFGEKSFLRISSCPYSAKAPIHQSHIYRKIKILRIILKKGHSRNISVKLFQNLTSSFGEEDFLRISSCPYSARSPHSPEPCLWTDQNFANIYEMGHPKNIPVKLFQNLTSSFGEEDFLRISSCPYSARRPHSPEPYFWADQNFANNFWKGSPKEHSCEIISKSGPAVSEEKIFKELLKKFNFVAMATRIFDGIKFCEQLLKRTSQGTFLQSLVQIGPAVWEKMFKEIVDDARLTHHHPKSSPWACCAQVS